MTDYYNHYLNGFEGVDIDDDHFSGDDAIVIRWLADADGKNATTRLEADRETAADLRDQLTEALDDD